MSLSETPAAPLDPAILDFVDRFASLHPFAGWVQRTSASPAHPEFALINNPGGSRPYDSGWMDLVRWPAVGYDEDAGKPFTAARAHWLQVPLDRLPPEIVQGVHAGLTQVLATASEIMEKDPSNPKGWGRIEVVSHLLSQYEHAQATQLTREEKRATRRPSP